MYLRSGQVVRESAGRRELARLREAASRRDVTHGAGAAGRNSGLGGAGCVLLAVGALLGLVVWSFFSLPAV